MLRNNLDKNKILTLKYLIVWSKNYEQKVLDSLRIEHT